jgi:hypothetical protein
MVIQAAAPQNLKTALPARENIRSCFTSVMAAFESPAVRLAIRYGSFRMLAFPSNDYEDRLERQRLEVKLNAT